MKSVGPSILIVMCVAFSAEDESVCVHPACGETRPVSLAEVARAQEEVRRKLSAAWEQPAKLTLDTPFESGLPGCGARRSFRVRTSVPAELVGRTLAFGPADRLPAGDIRVATSARRLGDVTAEALADRAMVERLRVQCAPTLVRVISEVELELVERP